MMDRALRFCLLLAVAACLLPAQPSTNEGVRGNLVTVDWLERHLKDADLLLLDASPTQAYGANHIPSAVNVDLYTYGLPAMPGGEMEKVLRSWGVSPGKTVVMYDPGAGMMATRMFFSLYYYGFPVRNLFVLDGGLSKWQAAGLPVTKDLSPAPKQGAFQVKSLRADARVELPEFLTASGDRANSVLVEALGANWHYGEVIAFNRAGHIPNSTLLPSADFYNPDKTFKSPDEIRKMLKYFGVRREQRIYTYCGGGVAASVPWFALKFILNYPQVKLYIESELGWLSDERELPYWTYDAPYLLRETRWLQAWNSQMMRMVGISRVGVLDVRPAGAFQQGHLPFALNVPAEVFRSNIGNPGKLAALLGAAGVDASHEAVVISGAGLNQDSALAFAMLEKLGQRKVSVFVDSLDKSAQLGFAMTKDPTVVGPKKGRQDVSIPPTTYPANVRNGIILADAKSPGGVYPKVLIASGRNVPGKAQDGTVVHVPYTDLLNADGTPKAAKDIWNILVKAGVPRYAELVCFSDDPGEAAANYFILRLMGFPDVKVLIL